MPDGSDQELKIHIVSDADVKGFQQASGAATKLKVDTSDLSDESKRMLGLTDPLTDATKKSAEAAELEGLSRREQRKVLLEVGNAAGGAGRALSELAYGPVGAALALVGVFDILKKSIDDTNKELDDQADLLAQPMDTGIKGIQKAWDDAAQALGKYHAEQADGFGADQIKKEIEQAKELITIRLEGEKKIAEALGDTARANYIQQALNQTGASTLIAEQSEREAAAKKLSPEQAIADEAAAKRKFDDDQKRLANARDALDPTTPAGKALKKKQDDAAAALDDANAQPDYIAVPGAGPADNRAGKAIAIARAQAGLDAANTAAAAQKNQKDQLEGSEAARQQAVTDAEDRRKIAEENAKRLTQLPGDIGQAQAQSDLKNHTDAVLAILSQHGGRMNETIGQLAKTLGYTSAQTESMLNAIVSGQVSFADRIARLEAQVRAIPAGTR